MVWSLSPSWGEEDGSLPPIDLSSIRTDLQKLDARVYGTTTTGADDRADMSGLTGLPLRSREIYRDYLAQANPLIEDLLEVRERFDREMTAQPEQKDLPPQAVLSLQQLGALTQRLSAKNLRFQSAFTHGEESFQSYQLIQKAIASLEDAIAYWRLSNRYRSQFRGELREKLEDDEVLTLKLQTALTAIDDLKRLESMRAALKTLDADTYP